MQMSEADIRKEYREAKNPEQQLQILAELNNTSITTIKQIINREPITTVPERPKRNNKIYTPSDVSTISRLWKEGAPIRQICDETGHSESSLKKYLAFNRDIFPPRIERLSEREKAKILERYDAGELPANIAKAIGRSSFAVYKTIKDFRRHED